MKMLPHTGLNRLLLRPTCIALGFFLPATLSAQTHTGHGGHDAAAQMDHTGPDAHADHGMSHNGKKIEMYDGTLAPNANYKRTTTAYNAPDVTLRDQTGADVNLVEFLEKPGPLAMQFIFTSCATVCPVLSASFAQSADDMHALDGSVRLLSVSIDPEYDTPERLAAYAKRYGAPDNWYFMTGERIDVRNVIMAFDALFESDNKVYHRPYTYLRAAPGDDWVRLDGLMSKASLLAEYRHILRRKSASVAK